MNKKIGHFLINAITVLASAGIGAYAIVAIMIPNGLTYGGVTGISRFISSTFHCSYSLIYYIIAAVVVVIVWAMLGIKEVKKIVVMSIAYPTMIALFENLDLQLLESRDLFLSALFLGVAFGVSNGIAFYGGFSAGGTDSLAKVVRNRFLPYLSISKLMFLFDTIIIVVQAFFFGTNIALYAMVSMFVSLRFTDMVIYGFSSKLVKLSTITKASAELTEFVMTELGRGVTSCAVVGEYTGEERKELMIYCSIRESMIIKRFLSQHDPKAFVSVMQVNSVWGEGKGFSDIHKIEEN